MKVSKNKAAIDITNKLLDDDLMEVQARENARKYFIPNVNFNVANHRWQKAE